MQLRLMPTNDEDEEEKAEGNPAAEATNSKVFESPIPATSSSNYINNTHNSVYDSSNSNYSAFIYIFSCTKNTNLKQQLITCIKKQIILNLIQPMTWITTGFFSHFKQSPFFYSNSHFILYFPHILFHYWIFFFNLLSTLGFQLFLHLLFVLFIYIYLSLLQPCLPVKLTLVLVVKFCLYEAILVFALDAIILLVFIFLPRIMK